jgi:drug/metabolite transporter (DMT)-like permease
MHLGAGIGALVLFGAVQITMIGWGLVRGERPHPGEWLGVSMALGGLAALTLPGAARPDGLSFLLMVLAGIAWGAYSLRGRGSKDALGATAGNFALSAPMALLVPAAGIFVSPPGPLHSSSEGVMIATASGAITSGVAYTFWYAALPGLTALRAAFVQLTVPVIAAVGAVVLLDERPSMRLAASGAAVLGGVALALRARSKTLAPKRSP